MTARLECKLLSESEHGEWDAFVRRSSMGSLFQSSTWVRLIGSAFGRRPGIFAVLREGELICGCPVYCRTAVGTEWTDPPFLAGYAGAIVHPFESMHPAEAGALVLEGLGVLEAKLRRRFGRARLIHAPGFLDTRAFGWGGWATIPRFSFALSLAGSDALLKTFEHSVRKQIRKAEDAGVTVHRTDAADEVLSHHEASYRRHDLASPMEAGRLREVTRQALSMGIARAYVARGKDGAPHASRVVLLDGHHAYDWIAGSDPAYLQTGSTSYNVWRILSELAADRGEFDFMGANTPSIARFKRGFGGALIPYYECLHATLASRGMLAARGSLRLLRDWLSSSTSSP